MRLLIATVFLYAGTLFADVPASSPQSMQRTLQNLSHSVSNNDQELALLKQKITNQESILDSMHTEVTALIKAAKESQKSNSTQVDTRLKAMEKNIDKLVSDLKQFKKHANETSTSFSELQKKIAEQQELTTLQAQQIKELESALRLIASTLQTKTTKTSSTSGNEYKVKAGDSLEKIAKEHNTTIEAIKKANNLSKDVIYPGQKLEIP